MQTHQPTENGNKVLTGNTTDITQLSGCFALVWTRGVSELQESGILQDVEGIAGVTSVRFTRKDPHILLASYEPDVTDTGTILKTIDRTNLNARIVGC